MARKEALNLARAMVQEKRCFGLPSCCPQLLTPPFRLASGDPNSIDLHGTTVPEALAIVQETLKDFNPSPSQFSILLSVHFLYQVCFLRTGKTLKIITGRGAHSVNQVAVLKPALKKSLVQEGWDVGSWEAGLIVRGRRS